MAISISTKSIEETARQEAALQEQVRMLCVSLSISMSLWMSLGVFMFVCLDIEMVVIHVTNYVRLHSHIRPPKDNWSFKPSKPCNRCCPHFCYFCCFLLHFVFLFCCWCGSFVDGTGGDGATEAVRAAGALCRRRVVWRGRRRGPRMFDSLFSVTFFFIMETDRWFILFLRNFYSTLHCLLPGNCAKSAH